LCACGRFHVNSVGDKNCGECIIGVHHSGTGTGERKNFCHLAMEKDALDLPCHHSMLLASCGKGCPC